MLTHHIAASGLLLMITFSGWINFGATVAFLHDIADITASLAKLGGQTPYFKVTLFWFFANMGIWGYTRNFVLLKLVYWIWTEGIYSFPPQY
jgi:hypothetical protein